MIPLLRPLIPQGWEKYYNKSLVYRQLTNFGPCHDELIERLSKRLNGYPVVCNSGTAAVQLALSATRAIGSVVGMPDYTHIGTLNAVVSAKCIPSILGCNKETWTVDPISDITAKDRLNALIVVSPFGYPIDFKMYDEWAEQNRIQIIYDLAGGWGMKVNTKNPYTFSFHGTKNFSVGEGGVAVFSNEDDAKEARQMSNFDIRPDGTVRSMYGYNFKMPEITCAMCLAHLDNEDKIMERIEIKRIRLRGYQYILNKIVPPGISNGAPSLCALGGFDVKETMDKCKRNGIIAKPYYPLLSDNIKYIAYPNNPENIGDPFFRTCVALPCDVTDEEFKYVCEVLK